jgi:UPF0755 protein
MLEDKRLIRASWAFERFVRGRELGDKLQAGTYKFTQAQGVSDIVDVLTGGKVAVDLFTIFPGSRIDEVKDGLVKAGYSEAEAAAALDPAGYANHPALVDKPAGASLEGFLYPESFQRDSSTHAGELIALSLNETAKALTPDLRQAFSKQSLSVFQAVTLASIVESEYAKADEKPVIAQVYLKRLREGRLLESDPTAKYGALLNGEEDWRATNSPYNTYKHAGLPPGPISNVTKSSLEAVANPAATDYLYFVHSDACQESAAAEGCRAYFARTLEEHEANVRNHCKQYCGSY